MAKVRIAKERVALRIAGAEARDFLHGLVTNAAEDLAVGEARYSALLTPQGKCLADFIMIGEEGGVLLALSADHVAPLVQRLSMYRLRRKLDFVETGLAVLTIWGEGAEQAAAAAGGRSVADPRAEGLGRRVYAEDADAAMDASGAEAGSDAEWSALRLALKAPEGAAEYGPDAYILEYGFEALHGVDFKKGCFVGQEIVARMKHKLELRRSLMQVRVEGDAAPGTPVTDDEGRPAGTLGTLSGGLGLAHLRHDRLDGPLIAGAARLTPVR